MTWLTDLIDGRFKVWEQKQLQTKMQENVATQLNNASDDANKKWEEIDLWIRKYFSGDETQSGHVRSALCEERFRELVAEWFDKLNKVKSLRK